VPEALRGAYEQLSAFARTGEVSGVSNLAAADVRALAKHLAAQNDRAKLLELLRDAVRMPAELVPEDAESLAGFCANWFQAVRGDKGKTEATPAATTPSSVVPIGFAAATDASGRIIATTACVKAGATKICGVFENHIWSGGVSHVLAVWRNRDEQKVVFQETELVRAEAASNYVWLETQEGWPAGHWQLDLFDPAHDFSLLATGTLTTE
jgi:hypothetical protein